MPLKHYASTSGYRPRLPPTPPDDRMHYPIHAMAGNMQYHGQPYHGHVPHRRPDDRGYEYANQFVPVSQPHQPMVPAMMYHQAPAYYSANIGPPPHAPAPTYYRPIVGPILPPIRSYDMPHHLDLHIHQPRPPRDKREEKPVGGVSAKLDYEMDDMTDFVAETSQAIVSSNGPTPPGFRKWVHQVLSATRLPSSTIILAFDYLAEHMRNIQTPYATEAGEMELHRLLTTALILGSKFLDDNTFINKSWAEVSGIQIEILNYMEREWLKEIGFGLHRDPHSHHGFHYFASRWKQFLHHRASQNMHASQPNLLGNMHGQGWMPRHMASPTSATDFSPRSQYHSRAPTTSYPTPSFSNYAPSFASRSANTSPPSAPYTSPTTPEYHGHQTQWNSLAGNLSYPRLPVSTVAIAPIVSAVSQATVQAPAFVPTTFPPPPAVAPLAPVAPMYSSGHGPECFCVPCNRQYMMAPHFGVPQSVAG